MKFSSHYQPLGHGADERNPEELAGQFPLYARGITGDSADRAPFISHGFDYAGRGEGFWMVGPHEGVHAVGLSE